MEDSSTELINISYFFSSAKKVSPSKIRAFASAYNKFLMIRADYTLADEECMEALNSAFGILASIDSIAVKAGAKTFFLEYIGTPGDKERVINTIDMAVRKKIAYQAIAN